MNWRYRTDREHAVVFVEADGHITQEELDQGAATIVADPFFHPDIRVLLDFSAASEWSLQIGSLSELGARPDFSANSRRAFVLQPGLPQAMFMMHRMSAHPGSVELFADRARAVAWLNEGVPADQRIS